MREGSESMDAETKAPDFPWVREQDAENDRTPDPEYIIMLEELEHR